MNPTPGSVARLLLLLGLGTVALPAQAAAGAARWSATAVADFVAAARERTLAAVQARGLTLPADFVAWVDADPVRKATVYGCRKDPLPVLLGLRALEIDLGAEVVRGRYEQLALAFAIQGSYVPPKRVAGGWNDGDGAESANYLPDISPRAPLSLVIPGDPRVWVDTKDRDRPLDRDDHILNFLEDHAPIEAEVMVDELPPLEYDDQGVAKPRGKAKKVKKTELRGLFAADVIASAALQAEFNAYMREHGHPEVVIECGDREVHWFATEAVRDGELRKRIAAAHELFHTAYRNKGRMPQARDAAPTPAESMAWFVRNDRNPPAGKAALFPLDAPWPLLLMLAADDQPLREREDIWVRYRDLGEMKTYGEYIGGIAQQFDMQSARRVAPLAFNYGSIQMMWKDGGVCGTMGNIGARTYRICGVPASTAGQPGHCAIVLFERDAKTGEYRCKGGQYATGGDEVTTVHAGWNYDDVGGRRPMVFHQSVAWGVNRGLASFVETLVLRRLFDAQPKAVQQQAAAEFVASAMAANPYALACVVGAIEAAADADAALAVYDAFAAAAGGTEVAAERQLLVTTVRDLAHARVAALPAPEGKAGNEALQAALQRQGCEHPALLARTWRAIGGEREFVAGTKAATRAYLASAERTKNKRVGERYAAHLAAWAKTVPGPKAKRAWADALLAEFAGRERFKLRGKELVDPAVEQLRKTAGVVAK